MSGASNLGWGNASPSSNVNGNFVNKYSENNPAFFTSNTVPGYPGLNGAKLNTDAASGIVPGLCFFKGGAKKLKKKIKNITKSYSMPKSKRKSLKKSMKRNLNNLRSKTVSASIAGGRRRRRRSHKRRQMGGGYAQYQNNQPFSNSYALGGKLSPYDSALANPVPIYSVSNNAIDNLNMFDRIGFPSRGHH